MDGDLTRVWQEIGQLQGGQSAQEARSGRIEDSIKNLSDETNRRFDGVKLHLDEQDKDIKQILINTAKHEGGEEQKKSAAETKTARGIVGEWLRPSPPRQWYVWVGCARALGCGSILHHLPHPLNAPTHFFMLWEIHGDYFKGNC